MHVLQKTPDAIISSFVKPDNFDRLSEEELEEVGGVSISQGWARSELAIFKPQIKKETHGKT